VAFSVGGSGSGPAFLISAGLVYEAIAAACSSPQTAEINVDKRAGTLMKWVHLGVAQALGFVLIAAWVDQEHRVEILAGGGTAAVVMYAQYMHAKSAGLKNGGPSTEG
jgi:cytochrome c oxidase assembly factor CtaG